MRNEALRSICAGLMVAELNIFVSMAVLTVLCAEVSLAAASPGAKAAELLMQHGIEEIVFAERDMHPDDHWYANFGYGDRGKGHKYFGRRGRLRILNLASGQIKDLLTDLEGTVRDPQVHYDGGKILFSYRRGGQMPFHLYEINVDGTGLRQLTDGIYDDIEPAYLPDGGIVFVSARSKRWVPCWFTQVATLYRCDGDGSNIQALSANVEQDNTPWVLPDGRILFTRWEYVDRSQRDFHHLWTCNPDGSNVAAFFGNMHPGDLYIDAKPIGDTGLVALIVSPGHGRREHAGHLAVLNPNMGPDDKEQLRIFSREQIVGQAWENLGFYGYRDIYPVAPEVFMAARGDNTVRDRAQGNDIIIQQNRFQLVVVLQDGTEHLLLESETPVHEPRPIVKRPRERIIPPRVTLKESTGTLILQNVYEGRKMQGIRPGEIKKLLVLEQLPKPINYVTLHDFVPISWGGSFFINRILGWVPVEADGSAYFKIPAKRAIFLVAADEHNASVKRMHSFLSVMPGETLSCIGCHENRTKVPRIDSSPMLQALSRPASDIQPLANNLYTFDYVRDIQPILDKHCVSCHNPDKPSARIILSGDNGTIFTQSFAHLLGRRLVVDGNNYRGNTAPRAVGDSASPLMALLQKEHHGVELNANEIETIRNWINASAFFPGIYAALGNGMVYERLTDPKLNAAEKQAVEVIERRCIGCHEDHFTGRGRISWGNWNRNRPPEPLYHTYALWNLSRPEKSTILLAPLAKAAGGWATDKATAIVPAKDRPKPDATARCPIIFESTSDPDYQIILDFARAGQSYLKNTDPRWYMPGWKPHEFYVREMIRYGVLPENFDREQEQVDPYAIDRRYFESMWHYPNNDGPRLFENPGIQEYYMKE